MLNQSNQDALVAHESVIKAPLGSSSYHYHQCVWDVVRTSEDQVRDFIFSVQEATSSAYIKIRSKSPHTGSKSIPLTLTSGALYRFSVVVTLDVEDVQDHHFNDTSVKNWFTRRISKEGVDVASVHLDFLPGIPMGKPGSTWIQKRFRLTGELCVMDAGLAGNLLLNGIGKGRAFGFGLIELERSHG